MPKVQFGVVPDMPAVFEKKGVGIETELAQMAEDTEAAKLVKLRFYAGL